MFIIINSRQCNLFFFSRINFVALIESGKTSIDEHFNRNTNQELKKLETNIKIKHEIIKKTKNKNASVTL